MIFKANTECVTKVFGSLGFALLLRGLNGVFAGEEIRKDDVQEGAQPESHAECSCLN